MWVQEIVELEKYQASVMEEESNSGTKPETGMEDEVLYAYYWNDLCECDLEMMDSVELSLCVWITSTIFNACPGKGWQWDIFWPIGCCHQEGGSIYQYIVPLFLTQSMWVCAGEDGLWGIPGFCHYRRVQRHCYRVWHGGWGIVCIFIVKSVWVWPEDLVDLVVSSFCVCITSTIFNSCPGDGWYVGYCHPGAGSF